MTLQNFKSLFFELILSKIFISINFISKLSNFSSALTELTKDKKIK